MSKENLKLCRKLDRGLDNLKLILDVYTELNPQAKEMLDTWFDEVYDRSHEVIGKLDISVCTMSDCSDLWEQDDLDDDGVCENCREE